MKQLVDKEVHLAASFLRFLKELVMRIGKKRHLINFVICTSKNILGHCQTEITLLELEAPNFTVLDSLIIH